MIFNRVTARDLDHARQLPGRGCARELPVPVECLAAAGPCTQWNGGVQNGLFIHALGRNSGEVFGVFADFAPQRLASFHSV